MPLRSLNTPALTTRSPALRPEVMLMKSPDDRPVRTNFWLTTASGFPPRSEEHTSELQSLRHLVCLLLLETPSTEIYTLSLHDALPIWPEVMLMKSPRDRPVRTNFWLTTASGFPP